MFLLDTVVVSETRKPSRHGGVMAWLDATPGEQQFVAAVTFWEIARGIDITRRQDPAKADQLWRWMQDLLSTQQILPATARIFVVLQRLLALTGRSSSIEDLLIVSTAQVHSLTVVTRNVRDFVGLGVPVFDPWTGRAYASVWLNSSRLH